MMDCGTITRSAGVVSTCGQTADATQVNGSTTTCTAGECTRGKMGVGTRENTRMIRSMASESIPGLMADSTTACGAMENNMVRASTSYLQVYSDEASGKKDIVRDGLMAFQALLMDLPAVRPRTITA